MRNTPEPKTATAIYIMDIVLKGQLNEEDIDFLNATSMEFNIFNSHGLMSETVLNDSGWCDVNTGSRIIGINDRVVFRNVQPEDLTLLNLKYYHRILILEHDGLRKIYKLNNLNKEEN